MPDLTPNVWKVKQQPSQYRPTRPVRGETELGRVLRELREAGIQPHSYNLRSPWAR